MRKNVYNILFIGCLSVCSVSCDENQGGKPYIYEGVEYNLTTKLNETSTLMYDPRDNTIYPVVRIDGQVWMAENLHYNIEGSELNPNNPEEKYGRLYDCHSANIACPEGWHLPSDADWKKLEKAMGMADIDLTKVGWRDLTRLNELKSRSGWNAVNNGTNSAGFNAYPAGRYESGTFKNIGNYAFFWTSTAKNATQSIGRYIFHDYSQISRTYIENADAQSCRCILD